jgi:hypothetical protein
MIEFLGLALFGWRPTDRVSQPRSLSLEREGCDGEAWPAILRALPGTALSVELEVLAYAVVWLIV